MDVQNNGLISEFKDLDKKDIEFNKKCSKLAQDITSGKSSILQLVEDLGPFLVDISANNRELGIAVLTQVLEGLTIDSLDGQQLSFICTFYADRLKDHHQVVPNVLEGIVVLTKFNQFPDGAATQLLTALFHHVACQQQQQNDRYTIYVIFDKLLGKHQNELCSMGLDYVYGVISAVDGERDPRNLLFLFKWFPLFLKTVQLGHLAEEMFEVLACYFPVDFRAPPQNSNVIITNITREDLSEALCPCLCAIPEFANYCLPLALEKLDSSLQIAKLDSLKLLKEGCRTFEVSSYLQHSTEIWSQIQKELFSFTDAEVELVCLETLSSVIRKLSESDESTFTNILKDITDTVKGNLLPDSKLFYSSSKFLSQIALASEASASFMAKEIVPLLTNTYNITNTSMHKVIILKILTDFVEAYFFYNKNEINTSISIVPMLCVKASIDQDSDLRIIGFESLKRIADFLPLVIRITVYENFRPILIISQEKEIRKSILNCFQVLSLKYCEEIQNNVLNRIIITDLKSLDLYLEALCKIAIQDYFMDFVTDFLLNESLKEIDTASVAINHMKSLLESNEEGEGKIQTILFNKNIIEKLINWSINEVNNNITGNNEELFSNLALILKSVVASQTVQTQKLLIEKQLPHIISLLRQKENCVSIFLLDGTLSRIRRDIELDYSILDDLLIVSINEPNSFIRNVSLQLLANLINKCSNEATIEIYLNKFEMESVQDNVEVISWITKALVMKNHSKAEDWTNKLLDLLEKDKEAVKGFGIVMNDNYDSLSTKSCCIKSLLYRQKFFVTVSNKLNENYKMEYPSYLTALGYLMEFAPQQAIVLQFNKILKLFVLCLEQCDDSEVLCVLLQILKSLIINKETLIEDHIEEFLSRLLNLSLNSRSMHVRIRSLQCIQHYTSGYPLYKLLPYKQQVLIQLGKCIDDKKRFVRKEAVEARSLWYLLDADT